MRPSGRTGIGQIEGCYDTILLVRIMVFLPLTNHLRSARFFLRVVERSGSVIIVAVHVEGFLDDLLK